LSKKHSVDSHCALDYLDGRQSLLACSYPSVSGGVMSLPSEHLPQIRFDITEAARILRVSRATLYERIRAGEIKA
jgi:hypothetical protein